MSACFAALLSAGAIANPTGGEVASGEATFATNGTTLTVTNSPNSIISWGSFSIANGETTRFMQQSASSAVLNRVVGTDPSSILGSLQSNGRVFLVNPNGIVFGVGSTVDVAGLVATTLNITDANFLTGTHHYAAGNTAGALTMEGSITAVNEVYLIAPNITISGVVTATNADVGEIIVASGTTVDVTAGVLIGSASTVTVAGDGLETVAVTGTLTATNITVQSTNPIGGGGGIGGGDLEVGGDGGGGPIIVGGDGDVSVDEDTVFIETAEADANLNDVTIILANSNITSGGQVTMSGGNVSLNTGGGNLVLPGSVSNSVITVSNTAGASINLAATPQFNFGGTATIQVAETRDAAGNVTGWTFTQ